MYPNALFASPLSVSRSRRQVLREEEKEELRADFEALRERVLDTIDDIQSGPPRVCYAPAGGDSSEGFVRFFSVAFEGSVRVVSNVLGLCSLIFDRLRAAFAYLRSLEGCVRLSSIA